VTVRLLPFFLVLISSASLGSDWPCYRGGNRDGVVTEQGLQLSWPAEGLKKLWSVPLEGKGAFAGPAVVGDKVYVPGRSATKDTINCLSTADGKTLWKFDYEAPGKLSYGSGPRATPVVEQGLVYTLGAMGNFVCSEIETGKKVWDCDWLATYKGKSPNFGIAAAPLIVGDAVICEPGGQGAAFVALDRKTGKEMWRCGNDASSYAQPQLVTIAAVQQILCFPATGLVSLNPADGKELWRQNFADAKNIAAPIVKNDIIYVSDNGNGLAAFKVSHDQSTWTIKRQWINAQDKAHTSSPVLGSNMLFFYEYFAAEGQIKCVDANDGHKLWALPPYKGQDMNGSLLLLDDKHLLVSLSTGDLILLEVSSEAGKEVGHFRAAAPGSFSPIAIADGKLYIRDAQAVTCYDLKAAK
jgi:outer membrane protein assembly factor BamB